MLLANALFCRIQTDSHGGVGTPSNDLPLIFIQLSVSVKGLRTIDECVDYELPVLLHQVVYVAEDATVRKEETSADAL